MLKCERGAGSLRRPPVPNGPTVEILFGGEPEGPDVGVVRVTVPPGGGMPEHDHGGSDVILLPQVGSVEVTEGGTTLPVGPGDALFIDKSDRVSLRNPGTTDAEVLVAVAPSMFVSAIRAWPAVDEN